MPEFDLQRFLAAQAPVYPQALAELRRGCKQSHWMWFVFPQIAGLGRSPTATYYAIGSLGEARAYLDHPVLGPRLRECTEAVLAHADKSADMIFGGIDALKFRSSMSLFEAVAGDAELFGRALDVFYRGARDPETLRLIGANS